MDLSATLSRFSTPLARAQRWLARGARLRHRQQRSAANPVTHAATVPASENSFFDAEFLRKLERLHLLAKRLQIAGAKGEHATVRKGFSLEFSDYRRYQRGDDLRYIDWNVYRRLDRLLLKVFTAEEELNVYLLVDSSLSMSLGMPSKLDYGKKIAAALGYIGLKNLDRVGGASFSSRLHAPLKLGRGRKQVLHLFNFLNVLGCDGETGLHAAMHSFSHLFPHPGLAIVISDLFDPVGWQGALKELVNKRYQVLLIHIVDRRELEPAVSGDLAFVDAENGRQRQCFLDESLLRRFERELQRYFNDIETFCSARKIDYLRTTTDVPFDDFVLQTLRRVSSVG